LQEKDRLIIEQIPRLRRYARALTGNAHAAEDLVQDCLERAWNKFHLWQTGSNMRAWMFTIMHNIHVNQVRKAISRPTVVTLNEWTDDRGVKPVQEKRVEVRNVGAALERLPEEQRAVVLLVGLEELSYQEVAKILDIPMGTVMSRLSRGREKLRGLLEESGVVPRDTVTEK
jgi:RNA polymerase sigma-70 factor (ECF subfamily)